LTGVERSGLIVTDVEMSRLNDVHALADGASTRIGKEHSAKVKVHFNFNFQRPWTLCR
jgi:hypothetical protein